MSLRSGILAGGNFIVDHINIVESFPQEGTLASITEKSTSNGGGPYNILKDLANLKVKFPLEAVGVVGKDTDGSWILDDLRANRVKTSLMTVSRSAATSYTQVMSSQASGQRTFFHMRGANAELDYEHFDFSKSKARFFYLGYLLLLDRLDKRDKKFGTRAARVLKSAKEHGFFTVIDCVSTDSALYPQIVLSTLRYVDGCILNDYEAERTTGIKLIQRGAINRNAVKRACTQIIKAGVGQWVVIHAPEGAYAMQTDGEFFEVSSCAVPAKKIKGTNGAGDAFAAGLLYALHEGSELPDALKCGCEVAAMSLTHISPSEGIRPLKKRPSN